MGKRQVWLLVACAMAASAATMAGCAQEQPDQPADAVAWTREEQPGDDAGGAAPGEDGVAPEGGDAAQEAPPDTVDFGATDATSALHSSATAFDTSRAWPLSREREVAALIGEGVASRLLDDLNGYLAPAGAEVGSALDVMVSEEGVRRSGATVRFRVMAYHAADRIVVDCTYDENTGRHAFARQP